MLVYLEDEPPVLWVGRVGFSLEMFAVRLRNWGWLRFYPHPEGWARRRGYYPRRGLRPFYQVWHIGPLTLMKWIGRETNED